MESIKYRSPTRVDLAGGTLDMWPLYDFVGGATTINVAIDVWTTAEIAGRDDSQVLISSADLKKSWSFADYADFTASMDPQLHFYKMVFSPFARELGEKGGGFALKTSSLSPIGGGLGGSSSLTISTLKALHHLLKRDLPGPHELVHLAHNIEAEMLRTPTGTQDYYPAVTGGLSFIRYDARRITQDVGAIEDTPLKDHFLLVYTGRSHHSGLNNFEVLKAAVEGNSRVMKALRDIKQISEEMRVILEKRDWSGLPELFNRETAARIQLTPAFTSPEIERLTEICLAAGALAVKICGAGGGGCVLVWVPPQSREEVVSACQKERFQCLNAKPVSLLK